MLTIIEARENGMRRVIQRMEGPSVTEQAHANETDINEIVRRYQRTGALPTRNGAPMYGDFTQVVDYHSAVEAVRQASEAFMMLPPEVRKRFGNNPGELLEFLSNESNREEAVKLGLVEAPEDLEKSQAAAVVPAVAPVVPADGQSAAGG